MAWCHVCDSDVPNAELLDHIRLLHPQTWDDDGEPGIKTWPDGAPVIVDMTAGGLEDVLADGDDESGSSPL